MSIFSKIKDAIFGHKAAAPVPAPEIAQQDTAATTTAPAPTLETPQPVDVEQVLGYISVAKGNPDLNYKTSIVDLLKMLDLDSSLAARKQLAQELNVHAGADGSAEQNIALSKAVMQKLAENGGKVPETMRH